MADPVGPADRAPARASDPAPDRASERAMEDAVRRYLGKVVIRYVPFVLAVAVFVAMVLIEPTLTPSSSSGGTAVGTTSGGGATAGTSGGASLSGESTNATGPGSSASSGSQGAGSTPGVAGSSSPGGSGGTTSNGSGGTTTAGGGSSTTPTTPPGPTNCAGGARQIAGSDYATTCAPAFHGSNGGATSFGVTDTTITTTFRISDSGEAAALAAASPTLNQQAQDQYYQDLRTYISYFNTQFQLYGRHVVLKEFNGQGDWVQEYQAQDPQGAEADAATAHSMGAFADLSSTAVATTPLFAQYLATDHVISAGGVAGSDHYFQTYAPYAYAAGASTSRVVDWMPNVICQRMKGLPAIFSGDPSSTGKTRKFGMIFPTNPDFQLVGNQVESALAACGVSIAQTYEYAINLTTMAQDSGTAMAKMRAAGITTVICLCDTVVPRFLSLAATAQGFHPEWVTTGEADTLAQAYDQSQWAHAISPSSTAKPSNQSEAYHVFLAASHGKPPVSLYYTFAYATAILFFDTLQNAGPNLTPASFQQGFFSLPPSLPGGDLGPWSFGPNNWTSVAAAPIGWWNPNAKSGANNAAGAWISCSGADGANHPWEPRSAYGTAGTQLHCFNK